MTTASSHIIVFDLDDTLFPEVDFLRSGYRAIARETARRGALGEDVAYDILNRHLGQKALDMLIEAQNEGGLTIREMIDVYRTHLPSIQLSDEVKRVLNQLKQNERIRAMGIITDGRINTQSNKIQALGLERFIKAEMIVISEAIGGDKFTSRPFEMIENVVNHKKSCFWYIGDNLSKDFVVANSRGWITVQIPPGPEAIHRVEPDKFQKKFHPRYIIPSITRLPALIADFDKNL